MSDFARLRLWLRRAAPRSRDLITALFMASLASLAGTGLFVGAVGLLVVSAQRPGLRAIGAFLVAIELVAFLRSPLRFSERMSTHRLGFAAVVQWRHWLMTTVGHWSYSRWQRYGSGNLLERSLTDTEELQDLWLRGVIPSVATLVTVLVSDVALCLMSPRGGWWRVALASAVVQLAGATFLVRRLVPQVRADRSLRARRGAYVGELVSSRNAAPEIELLGASDFLRRRDARFVADLHEAELAQRRIRRGDLSIILAVPLLCLWIVALAPPRSAHVWIIVASLLALATFEALSTLRGSIQRAAAVTGGAERLDELTSSAFDATATWPADYTMHCEDVVVEGLFGPRRITATILPGRRVALIGPSGAGKSTLLRALAHLDVAVAGAITFGGTNVATIPEEELRAHLVLVPSEPGLFRGYVRDVVGMGRDLSDDDFDALLRLGLPVSRNDRWDELSRGERQRVALVRALTRHADVVLLDEPTSALGNAETSAVLDLLSTLSATVIVATHDPRLIAWCDEVIDLAGALKSENEAES